MKRIIATPDAPKAVGPYSQAVELNGTLYLSGQLPVDPATGRMPEGVEAQTRQSLANLGAILTAAGLTFSDIAKTTVLLADIADFGAMNAVRLVTIVPSGRRTVTAVAFPERIMTPSITACPPISFTGHVAPAAIFF